MQISLIKEINKQDLDEIISLHSLVLDESFINNFGSRFLKLSYSEIIKNKNNVCLVVKQRNRILAYLVATKNDFAFTKNVISRRFFSLFWEVLKASIKKPKLLYYALTWFIGSFDFNNKEAELKFIAVNPKFQGKGIGTKLLKNLDAEFDKYGIARYLVGTKKENKLSNMFYKKSGFIYLQSKRFFGNSFNYYSSAQKTDVLKPNGNYWQKIILGITSLFLLGFIIKATVTMIHVPFYDFDEAHRAENAKRMKEYKSFFVPLTGSSQDRVEHLKIPLKEAPVMHLYYHLERPFLIYLSIVSSTSLLGETEWAYRLPSFLFGISTLLVFVFFTKLLTKKVLFIPFLIGFISLLTSSDLWLSSQYAQLDTGITFFMSISLFSLIVFAEVRKKIFLQISGLSLALSVLSKGQPAVLLILPLLYLVVIKKLKLKDLLRFVIYASIILVPWVTYLTVRFGLKDVVEIVPGFSLAAPYIHQKAPVFWYLRWFWESLRPGWTLFLALTLFDMLNRKIDWKQKTLLVYIFGALLILSLQTNKIWWYALPVIPSIGIYIYLSFYNYIKSRINVIAPIVTILASMPVFLKATNTAVMVYGIIITIVLTIILKSKISLKTSNIQLVYSLFLVATVISLASFYNRFPNITPYHQNTKYVATFYKHLPGRNCLWAFDMPTEAALFYSNAGEINLMNEQSSLGLHCKHYLITPSPEDKLPDLKGLQHKQVILQQGDMRLFKI